MTANGKQENAEATRKALVQAGRELFGRHGFAAAGVGAICAAAGVTTGALYHHFGDKVGLFAAVAEDMDRGLAQVAAHAAAKASDPWQGFLAGAEAFLTASQNAGVRRIGLEDAPSVLGAARWREIRRRNGLGYLREAVATLQHLGVLEPGEPDVIAALVIGLLMGAAETLADRPDDTAWAGQTSGLVRRMLAPLRQSLNMADALKTFFNAALVRRLADQLRATHPAFPSARFVREATQGLDSLELLARAQHLRDALRRALPPSYPQAVDILVRSLGPELPQGDGLGVGMAPFQYLPHVLFVAEYGLEDFEVSMRAQHALTRRFSAEFSIRHFLERHPEATLAWLRRWAREPNAHVRRLVSEGTRPRLPWAMRLRRFQEDPRPVLELLELLKDDPSPYVRRSVANNLNDIGKDHPEVLAQVCARWMKGAAAERVALVRHALRSAIKRGERGALVVLGFGDAAHLQVEATVTPARVRLGETIEVEVAVHNATSRPQRAVVDLAVHFVKADGQARPKVFKLKAVELPPGDSQRLRKRISFKEMTTRKHHAGRHAVEVLVNGAATPVGHVDVVEGAGRGR